MHMKYVSLRRPFLAWVLIVLLFLLGAGAIISGMLLFAAPDGHLLGMSVDLLEGSPFTDFLVPGIILFWLIGVFQVFAAIGLLTRTPWNGPDVINPFKSYHWTWTASLASGVIMLIWILTETLLLGYISPLQPVIAVWGIVLLFLTLLTHARRYYRRQV